MPLTERIETTATTATLALVPAGTRTKGSGKVSHIPFRRKPLKTQPCLDTQVFMQERLQRPTIDKIDATGAGCKRTAARYEPTG